jgi:hypothetical protein
MKIFKIGIQKPCFRDPDMSNYKTKLKDDKNKLVTYETCFLVWNMCETAYDRKKIDKTWRPVIEEEKRLHLVWFKHSEK